MQNIQSGCTGVPAAALALVGNATVDNSASRAPDGYVTLFPSGAPPNASNVNYHTGQIVPNAFTVGLAGGNFAIYATSGTHFLIDVVGYYSLNAADDGNGVGLRYNQLSYPLRLLDTRAGQQACVNTGAPLPTGSDLQIITAQTCTMTEPDFGGLPAGTARALVGNATVDNSAVRAGAGYVTLYPDNVGLPLTSTVNYAVGQVVPNAFIVGLGPDGGFKIHAYTGTHFIVDYSGYFAP